jgi:hypothetical protein
VITCSGTRFTWEPAKAPPCVLPVGAEGLVLLVQEGRMDEIAGPYWMVMVADADRVHQITKEADVITSDSIYDTLLGALDVAVHWRARLRSERPNARGLKESLDHWRDAAA